MKRLVVTSFLLTLCVAIAVYLANLYWRDRVLADGERVLSDRAWVIANSLDFMLQQRMTQAFTFAALPSVRGFATADPTTRSARAAVAQNELRSIVASDPNIRAASILDVNGVVSLTTDSSMLANWGDRPFAREALRGQLFASPTSLDFGEISQYYSAPILDNNGDVAGAFVMRVATQEFWNLLTPYSNVRVVDEYSVRLADRSKTPLTLVVLSQLRTDVSVRLLSEKHYGAELARIDATNLKPLADAVTNGNTWIVDYNEMDGRFAHAAIRRLRTYPWTVIAFEYDDVIMASVRDIWLGAAGFGMIVAIIAVSLGWMLGGMRETN